jgi:phosphatidate cytidylyltransferase
MNRAGAWIAGFLVLVPAGIGLARLRYDLPHGEYWTIYCLVLVGVADTGAYFSGRAFGRHKLAPEVSPGKTWEGVAGGLVLAATAAVVASFQFSQPLLPMIAIGLVIAAFSVVGDLMESLLKRFAGLKDSGHIIPGHGGLMDRLDSVAAAAPLLLLSVIELLAVHP